MTDNQQVVTEKIARIRAAVALRPHDRVPLTAISDFWPVRYAQKYTMQQAYYSLDVAAECYETAFSRWNSWDAVGAAIPAHGPVMDATGSRRFRVPGRGLSPDAEFQHPDLTLMGADEYPYLIRDPVRFHVEQLIPRLCTKMASDDALVRTTAWTKAASFYAQFSAKGAAHARRWSTEYGIPSLFQGPSLYVPIDLIADKLRGFRQGLLDIKQRPKEVADACEALVPFILSVCLAAARSVGDYPLIFNPQHVSPFVSPSDYQKIYWPTYSKMVNHLVERGYKVWSFLENNQEQHLECLQDLPKGKVVAHFESTDLARAKKALCGRLCIAGGMPSVLLTRGTPQEVTDHTRSVLKLFEDEPGFIMTCTTTIPSTARPENITAWLDAVREYGGLGSTIPTPSETPEATAVPRTGAPIGPGLATAWETVKPELGEIKGDEGIIRDAWELLEKDSLLLIYSLIK